MNTTKTIEKKSLYELLSAPIPKNMLVTYTENKKEFTGYHAQYAIDLLNETVGLENVEITEEILKQEMIGKAWFVSMRVAVIIAYGGKTIARSGYGASFSTSGANAYKGAKTSAFKNACRFYGIGKELYIQGFEDENSGDQQTEKKDEERQVDIEDSETGGNAEVLITKISEAQTEQELEVYRNEIINFEAGEAVKKLLLKKFNNKLISLGNKL